MLHGKVVVVTGAARGLGRGYAVALARQGTAGVVVGDIADCAGTADLVRDAGGKVLACELDVTSAASAQEMVARTMQAFGRLDGLVNNAALYGPLKGNRFESIPEEEWDAAFAVNVKGVWNCCKAAVPSMRAGGGGSIVNVSSLAATYGMPQRLHYTASKAAVIGLTRGLARELGRDAIRVNAIAPSAVLTEGTSEFFADKTERAMQVIRGGQAIPRTLTGQDLVSTVIYLLADGSELVTGQTLSVDGGTVMR